MSTKWVDEFCDQARKAEIFCDVEHRVLGWPETVVLNGHTCYAKSVSFKRSSNGGFYFQGVDPKKLHERGDFVLVCGGFGSSIRDIFLIPWKDFFGAISHGTLVNTYKPPKQYLQYKFRIKNDGPRWVLVTQGSDQKLDVTPWRYDLAGALEGFATVSKTR